MLSRLNDGASVAARSCECAPLLWCAVPPRVSVDGIERPAQHGRHVSPLVHVCAFEYTAGTNSMRSDSSRVKFRWDDPVFRWSILRKVDTYSGVCVPSGFCVLTGTNFKVGVIDAHFGGPYAGWLSIYTLCDFTEI